MQLKTREKVLDLSVIIKLTSLGVALLAALLISAGSARAEESKMSSDTEAAIKRTIDTYIEGGRKGDSQIMRQAFHPDAIIYGVHDGEAGGGAIQGLYDLVDGKPPAGDIPYTVTVLNQETDIAIVRLDIPDWAGTHYTDMFAMLKDGEDWKIITKLWHVHP